MLPSHLCRAVFSSLIVTTLSLTASMTAAQPLIATRLGPSLSDPLSDSTWQSPLFSPPSSIGPEIAPPQPNSDDPSAVKDSQQAVDPLNSQYPVPWQWILQTQQNHAEQQRGGLSYYRSPALISPSGKYAAYSRIEIRAAANLYETKVVSVLFIEDLATGKLEVVRSSSPIASYLEEVGEDSPEMAGVISILIPASWSSNGDYLLARQLEGAFNSSDISDYAVVWQGPQSSPRTLSPLSSTITDASATLLGWNQANPNEILFKVTQFEPESTEPESVLSVMLDGNIQQALDAEIVGFGQMVSRSWTGVQLIQ